jgi:hypothetical protein
MPGAKLDIEVICGRDFYLAIQNQTAAGNPWDLRGYLTYMTVKASINDPDASALYQGAPYSANPGFGQLTFQLSHALTGPWWPPGSGPISTAIVYDVAYADDATPVRNWNTVLSGAVTLAQPVAEVIPGG